MERLRELVHEVAILVRRIRNYISVGSLLSLFLSVGSHDNATRAQSRNVAHVAHVAHNITKRCISVLSRMGNACGLLKV